jgi:hypothetical protein
MERLVKFMILLSVFGGALADSKPVVVRSGGSGQLFTSSLLTWEVFANDSIQFKHAVSAGTFQGEDVSQVADLWG